MYDQYHRSFHQNIKQEDSTHDTSERNEDFNTTTEGSIFEAIIANLCLYIKYIIIFAQLIATEKIKKN